MGWALERLGVKRLIALSGVGLVVASLFAAALKSAPEELQRHSIGLLNLAIFVGSFVRPLLLSPIAARFGYSGLYLAMAVVVGGVGLVRGAQLRWRTSFAALWTTTTPQMDR